MAEIPGVLAVHRVRMRWIGHELQADADLELDAGIPQSHAHAIAHRAEAALVRSVPRLASAVVHAYPATAVRSEVRAQG
jgi:divalent metal cation (Fe/Co/Zn/Cd) transporter